MLISLFSVQDGDSGSWVVCPVSKQVYGQVVATDALGDVYVVPLHACFDEMKELISGVESVDLPTTADLLDLALRSSSSTSNSRSSTGSLGSADLGSSRPVFQFQGRPLQEKLSRNIQKAREEAEEERGENKMTAAWHACSDTYMRKASRIFTLSDLQVSRLCLHQLRDDDSGYGSVESEPAVFSMEHTTAGVGETV